VSPDLDEAHGQRFYRAVYKRLTMAAVLRVGVVNEVVHLAGTPAHWKRAALPKRLLAACRECAGWSTASRRLGHPAQRVSSTSTGLFAQEGKKPTMKEGNQRMTKVLAKWLRKFHRWIAVPTALQSRLHLSTSWWATTTDCDLGKVRKTPSF
jgi:hypothetical protein